MKSVLISIRPKWCEKIANGKKTIEVRKSAPKEVPFKAYIYETKKEHLRVVFKKGDYIFSDDHSAGKFDENIFVKDRYSWQGKVIGEFICDKIYERKCERMTLMYYSVNMGDDDREYKQIKTCLTPEEEWEYGKGKTLYGWHISDLKIYDKPKELSEFRKPLNRVWGAYCNDYCDRGCISFGSTDYSCNDYWNWEKGLTRPPQSWCYVEELCKVRN